MPKTLSLLEIQELSESPLGASSGFIKLFALEGQLYYIDDSDTVHGPLEEAVANIDEAKQRSWFGV